MKKRNKTKIDPKITYCFFFIIFIVLFNSCIPGGKWGNNIEFINELDIEIDSIEMVVCDTKSMLLSIKGFNGEKYIDHKPNMPSKGYPCPVKIKVFSGQKEIILKADTFDCYHCDNSKYYVLSGDSAIFTTYYIAGE